MVHFNRCDQLVAATAACFVCMLAGCGLLESDTNKQTHKTQIVSHIDGTFANIDEAVVTVDGKPAGKATFTDVATLEVDSGKHVVAAVNKAGLPWGDVNVDVLAGQTMNVWFHCTAAHFVVTTDPNCSRRIVGKLHIALHMMNLPGPAEAVITPGESVTFDVPADGIGVLFRDDTGTLLQEQAPYGLVYNTTYNTSFQCP